jgi:hypothetical protein
MRTSCISVLTLLCSRAQRCASIVPARSLALQLALGLALGLASSAHAQSYEGVVPGSDVIPDKIAAAPGQGSLVTWPGFQMLPNGGSRVFVQTSVEVIPELKRDAGDNWQLVLPMMAIPSGNARLLLDTHFFNTPVKSVRALARAGGVVVLLDMRAKLKPIVRTERAANGYFFTYLEFPPGNFVAN